MNTAELVLITTFYGLSSLLGILLNGLLIISILLSKEIRQRNANKILCSLCFSDLLTCAYSIPYHLFHLYPSIYGIFISQTYCVVTQYFIYSLAFSSTLCLTAMSLDRYFAICHPFAYHRYGTRPTVVISIVWPWIHSAVTALPVFAIDMVEVSTDFGFPCGAKQGFDTTRYFTVITPINILIPCICIVITNIFVLRTARRQLRSIQVQQNAVSYVKGNTVNSSIIDNEENSICLSDIHGSLSGKQQHQNSSNLNFYKLMLKGRALSPLPPDSPKFSTRRKESKRGKCKTSSSEEKRLGLAIVPVVVGFFVAWTPYLITRVSYFYYPDLQINNGMFLFGTCFVLFHSTWNPVLILSFRREIRRRIKSSIFKKSH